MINKDLRQLRMFCKDFTEIENYDKAVADTTQKWECHHRLEFTINGEVAHSKDELKRLGMYYHRPYFELIFLPAKEHRFLHLSARDRKDINKKISTTLKGHSFSEESRKKISKAVKAKWQSKKVVGI